MWASASASIFKTSAESVLLKRGFCISYTHYAVQECRASEENGERETRIEELSNTLQTKSQEPSKNNGMILHTLSDQEVHVDTTVNT